MANFALKNSRNETRTLQGLLALGPIVLCFIRGKWCPYCQAELEAWRFYHDALQEAGGRLVVVTAETSVHARSLPEIVGPDVEILCDADHGLALANGLAFWCGDALQQTYRGFDIDLEEVYGNASGFLTVPATFVVDSRAKVRFGYADPDFRLRAEPCEVIDILSHAA